MTPRQRVLVSPISDEQKDNAKRHAAELSRLNEGCRIWVVIELATGSEAYGTSKQEARELLAKQLGIEEANLNAWYAGMEYTGNGEPVRWQVRANQ